MPSLDIYHELVKTALQAQGWTITHDPYYLSAGGTELYFSAVKPCSRDWQGYKARSVQLG